jgi:hypothetical protein
MIISIKDEDINFNKTKIFWKAIASHVIDYCQSKNIPKLKDLGGGHLIGNMNDVHGSL